MSVVINNAERISKEEWQFPLLKDQPEQHSLITLFLSCMMQVLPSQLVNLENLENLENLDEPFKSRLLNFSPQIALPSRNVTLVFQNYIMNDFFMSINRSYLFGEHLAFLTCVGPFLESFLREYIFVLSAGDQNADDVYLTMKFLHEYRQELQTKTKHYNLAKCIQYIKDQEIPGRSKGKIHVFAMYLKELADICLSDEMKAEILDDLQSLLFIRNKLSHFELSAVLERYQPSGLTNVRHVSGSGKGAVALEMPHSGFFTDFLIQRLDNVLADGLIDELFVRFNRVVYRIWLLCNSVKTIH